MTTIRITHDYGFQDGKCVMQASYTFLYTVCNISMTILSFEGEQRAVGMVSK